MSSQAVQTLLEPSKKQPTSIREIPRLVQLELSVTDSDSVTELVMHDEGPDRQQYALSALRIGLLSLRHARGQVDAEAVRQEGERLLSELRHALETSRVQINDGLTSCLREYFDPTSGKFQERVERLIEKDGELERLLRGHIGQGDSEMTKTLAGLIGPNSALMKVLDPDEANGVVSRLRESIGESLTDQREQVLTQFSLDNKQSALSRLVEELNAKNGDLHEALTTKINEVINEFSLDEKDSALSRLVQKVEVAQATIVNEFSLDNQQSALSRMTHFMSKATEAIENNLSLDLENSGLSRLKRELLDILDRQEQQASSFQSEVKASLAEIRTRRDESARSTTHGKDFEGSVWSFVQHEAQKSGDVPAHTGKRPGTIRNCKIGDAIITLGDETSAPGERIVVEAKEDSSYDLEKARDEIRSARKNRQAGVGLFVFSRRTAPTGQDILVRHGSDIFVIWDEQDLQSDVNLRAAIMVARALSVKSAKARDEEAADFEKLDKAILELERESKRLTDVKKWTETIKGNSTKILDEVAKMTEGMQKQIDAVRQATGGLKATHSDGHVGGEGE